jgi:hypothetical protein
MARAIDFKFTPEQQERFNLILDETKRIHPDLLIDDVSKERIKVLIAHTVIHGDLPFKKEQEQKEKEEEEKKEEVFNEIKD